MFRTRTLMPMHGGRLAATQVLCVNRRATRQQVWAPFTFRSAAPRTTCSPRKPRAATRATAGQPLRWTGATQTAAILSRGSRLRTVVFYAAMTRSSREHRKRIRPARRTWLCELRASIASSEPVMMRTNISFDYSSARITDVDGRLHVADCKISAARVNEYLGSEIPGDDALGLDPRKLYRMYRDAGALRAAATSFENLPLMDNHLSVRPHDPQKSRIVGNVSNERWKAPYLVADHAVSYCSAIVGIVAD